MQKNDPKPNGSRTIDTLSTSNAIPAELFRGGKHLSINNHKPSGAWTHAWLSFSQHDGLPAKLFWGGKHISINDYKPSGARCYNGWDIVGRQTYIDKRLQT